MNIFFLSLNPESCARQHCDKHTVKMVIEYAQLLSTAHRMLDGHEYIDLTNNNRKIKRWRLNDDRESMLYKASHINHPSAVWVRKSVWNYRWLHDLLSCTLDEYTFRYEKIHLIESSGLKEALFFNPMNIPKNVEFSEPPLAMPDDCKISGQTIDSYRRYYIEHKVRFARWTKRQIPSWFTEGCLQRMVEINESLGLYENANIQLSEQNHGRDHRTNDENLRTEGMA